MPRPCRLRIIDPVAAALTEPPRRAHARWSVRSNPIVRNHEALLFRFRSPENQFNAPYAPVTPGRMGREPRAVFPGGVCQASPASENDREPGAAWREVPIIDPRPRDAGAIRPGKRPPGWRGSGRQVATRAIPGRIGFAAAERQWRPPAE